MIVTGITQVRSVSAPAFKLECDQNLTVVKDTFYLFADISKRPRLHNWFTQFC